MNTLVKHARSCTSLVKTGEWTFPKDKKDKNDESEKTHNLYLNLNLYIYILNTIFCKHIILNCSYLLNYANSVQTELH